jgi:hypothetical protein
MELRHFMHPVGKMPSGASEDCPERQSVSVWDTRTYTEWQLYEHMPELLRELEVGKTSHFDRMPWLRGILLVPPLTSDALAVSVMDRGVVVLETPRENPAIQVVEQFLHEASRFQSIATSCARTASHDPSSPSRNGDGNTESEFSRAPAYFNHALYDEWLEKLSQPWRQEDAFDSES